MTSYFVWYRIAADPANARAIVERLLRAVRRQTGVQGRILARTDAGPATWMEIYEDVSDARAFEAALDASVAITGAHAIADGGRHTERFEALPAG
jgi:hypothetical protein